MKSGMQLMAESNVTLLEASIDGLKVIARRRGQPISQGDVQICELAIRCLEAMEKLSKPQSREGKEGGDRQC